MFSAALLHWDRPFCTSVSILLAAMASWNQNVELHLGGERYPSGSPRFGFIEVEHIGRRCVKVAEDG